MALVERLMQLDSEPDDRHIAVHQFFALMHELVEGNVSRQDIKDHYEMTAEDEQEFDAIADIAPPGQAGILHALFTSRIHAVFILAETSEDELVPGYDTPSAIRSKLGI